MARVSPQVWRPRYASCDALTSGAPCAPNETDACGVAGGMSTCCNLYAIVQELGVLQVDFTLEAGSPKISTPVRAKAATDLVSLPHMDDDSAWKQRATPEHAACKASTGTKVESAAVVGNGPITNRQREEISKHGIVVRYSLLSSSSQLPVYILHLQFICWQTQLHRAASSGAESRTTWVQIQLPQQHVAGAGKDGRVGCALQF